MEIFIHRIYFNSCLQNMTQEAPKVQEIIINCVTYAG